MLSRPTNRIISYQDWSRLLGNAVLYAGILVAQQNPGRIVKKTAVEDNQRSAGQRAVVRRVATKQTMYFGPLKSTNFKHSHKYIIIGNKWLKYFSDGRIECGAIWRMSQDKRIYGPIPYNGNIYPTRSRPYPIQCFLLP